jgi:two-component system, OmpR family, response regulator RegX3
MERRVVIIEDERDVARLLEFNLRGAGYTVACAGTGGEGLAAIRTNAPDVVILDLMLPDQSGYDVCKAVRADATLADIGVLMLTAKGEPEDRILGLEVGADDYVVKPFGLRELVARIRAVRRRSRPSAFFATVDESAQSVGPLTIDRRTRRVSVDASEVLLTPREFDLLAFLAHEPDTVHRRQHILEEVWDAHWWGSTRTLDVHVAALRRKLGHPEWIETVRGVGFRFRPSG